MELQRTLFTCNEPEFSAIQHGLTVLIPLDRACFYGPYVGFTVCTIPMAWPTEAGLAPPQDASVNVVAFAAPLVFGASCTGGPDHFITSIEFHGFSCSGSCP